MRREEYTVVGGIAARIAQQLRTSFLTGEDRRKEPAAVTIDSPTAKADEAAAASSDGSTPRKHPRVCRAELGRGCNHCSANGPGVVVAGAMAVLIAAAYLLAAPMGRDSVSADGSCSAGRVTLARAAEPAVVWRFQPARLQRPVSTGDGVCWAYVSRRHLPT